MNPVTGSTYALSGVSTSTAHMIRPAGPLVVALLAEALGGGSPLDEGRQADSGMAMTTENTTLRTECLERVKIFPTGYAAFRSPVAVAQFVSIRCISLS